MAVLPETNRFTHDGAVKQGPAAAYPTYLLGGLLREASAAGATQAAGVYTLRCPLPARAHIIDIGVQCISLWTAGSTAALIVGDDADDNGFFTSTNLLATDLIVGETNNIEHPGGLAGAYIVSEQRLLYQDGPRTVIFQVTTTGASGSGGKTRCYVLFAVDPNSIASYDAT